jgi:hypothetical protein
MAGRKARKSGGAVPARASGGSVSAPAARAYGGKVCAMPSPDKPPKRARGGRVGADTSPMAPGSARHPFSSAHRK